MKKKKEKKINRNGINNQLIFYFIHFLLQIKFEEELP